MIRREPVEALLPADHDGALCADCLNHPPRAGREPAKRSLTCWRSWCRIGSPARCSAGCWAAARGGPARTAATFSKRWRCRGVRCSSSGSLPSASTSWSRFARTTDEKELDQEASRVDLRSGPETLIGMIRPVEPDSRPIAPRPSRRFLAAVAFASISVAAVANLAGYALGALGCR